MATLRDIKRRIVGVKNTQQITKAMKMVAAARLKRAQDNMLAAKPYSQKVAEVLSNLIRSENNISNPLFVEREVKKIAVVLLTSDRGLCGGFNMNAIRKAQELIQKKYKSLVDNNSLSLYCVGKKGNDFFKKNFDNVSGSYPGIFSELKFEFASSMVTDFVNKFLKGEIDKVVVVYNQFKSVVQQEVVEEQLLPILPFETSEEDSASNTEFIFEPDKISIINSLLPKHLNAQFWKALLESYAAELGARMTAMDMATENAKEIIRSLQIKYNKERQAAITKEILEIVSGANALKSA
ncbi:MAG: ATP synthase F1 subunit gamma [Melioribacteraceae bacterium]|nr:ATP synthase F1 subunit gamma [Melioribacteraceae bacterium]MCO6473997.1 ATP synthase F1 subunit gamma [Melioribacteraceae bacterium]MDD3557280.1 ATP synthase F1 subunit gamma [Melioribacteraceae bacterium]